MFSFLVVGFLASLVPFWRDSRYPGEGRNAWEYFSDVHDQAYYDSHIPYEDAVEEAQSAWRMNAPRNV